MCGRWLPYGENIAPGHYYFGVVVDPENAIGAYRMHRSEFVI